jgi:hypothetical protein
MAVLFCLSCSSWLVVAVMFWLSCSGYLSFCLHWLYYPCSTVLATLSWQPFPGRPVLGGTVFAVLSKHPCPDSPFLGVLSWQTCSACPVLPFLSSCPVLRDLFCVSCPASLSAWPVLPVPFSLCDLPVLFRSSRSGSPVLAVLFWLSFSFILSCLS